jgi:hypothetical protein
MLWRRFILREEDAVLFLSEHRNQIPRRVRRFRLEVETGFVGRPLDGGAGAEERTLKALRAIVNLRCRDDTIPFHVERNRRAHGSDRCDERIGVVRIAGQSQPKGQRVCEVMIIEDLQPTHSKACSRFVEIYFDGVLRDWDHPEHVVRVDVQVEIVDLFREVGRSGRTGVQVKSNKGERALMAAAVRTDELALGEAHVRLERQRHGTRTCACSSPGAANMRETDEPVEVSDLRRVVDVGKRDSGI